MSHKRNEMERIVAKYEANIGTLEEGEEDLMRRIKLFENVTPLVLVWQMWKTSRANKPETFSQQNSEDEAQTKITHLQTVLNGLDEADRLLKEEEQIMRQRIAELETSIREPTERILPSSQSKQTLRQFQNKIEESNNKFKSLKKEQLQFNESFEESESNWKKTCKDLLNDAKLLKENLNGLNEELRELEKFIRGFEEKETKKDPLIQERALKPEERLMDLIENDTEDVLRDKFEDDKDAIVLGERSLFSKVIKPFVPPIVYDTKELIGQSYDDTKHAISDTRRAIGQSLEDTKQTIKPLLPPIVFDPLKGMDEIVPSLDYTKQAITQFVPPFLYDATGAIKPFVPPIVFDAKDMIDQSIDDTKRAIHGFVPSVIEGTMEVLKPFIPPAMYDATGAIKPFVPPVIRDPIEAIGKIVPSSDYAKGVINQFIPPIFYNTKHVTKPSVPPSIQEVIQKFDPSFIDDINEKIKYFLAKLSPTQYKLELDRLMENFENHKIVSSVIYDIKEAIKKIVPSVINDTKEKINKNFPSCVDDKLDRLRENIRNNPSLDHTKAIKDVVPSIIDDIKKVIKKILPSVIDDKINELKEYIVKQQSIPSLADSKEVIQKIVPLVIEDTKEKIKQIIPLVIDDKLDRLLENISNQQILPSIDNTQEAIKHIVLSFIDNTTDVINTIIDSINIFKTKKRKTWDTEELTLNKLKKKEGTIQNLKDDLTTLKKKLDELDPQAYKKAVPEFTNYMEYVESFTEEVKNMIVNLLKESPQYTMEIWKHLLTNNNAVVRSLKDMIIAFKKKLDELDPQAYKEVVPEFTNYMEYMESYIEEAINMSEKLLKESPQNAKEIWKNIRSKNDLVIRRLKDYIFSFKKKLDELDPQAYKEVVPEFTNYMEYMESYIEQTRSLSENLLKQRPQNVMEEWNNILTKIDAVVGRLKVYIISFKNKLKELDSQIYLETVGKLKTDLDDVDLSSTVSTSSSETLSEEKPRKVTKEEKRRRPRRRKPRFTKEQIQNILKNTDKVIKSLKDDFTTLEDKFKEVDPDDYKQVMSMFNTHMKDIDSLTRESITLSEQLSELQEKPWDMNELFVDILQKKEAIAGFLKFDILLMQNRMNEVNPLACKEIVPKLKTDWDAFNKIFIEISPSS